MNTTYLQPKSDLTLATYAENSSLTMAQAIAESKPLSECDLESIIFAFETEWKLTSAAIGHKFDIAAFQLIAEETAKNLRTEFKHMRLSELALMGSKGRALKFGEFTHVSPVLFMKWCEAYMKLDERFEAHREAVKPVIQEQALTQEENDALNLKAVISELENPTKQNEHSIGMKASFLDFCIRKKYIEPDQLFSLQAISHFKAILATKTVRSIQDTSHDAKARQNAAIALNSAGIYTRKQLESYSPTETERKVFESVAKDAKAAMFDEFREMLKNKLCKS